MTKIFDRLFLDSCHKKPSQCAVDTKKDEEEKWEKLLLSTNKIQINSAPIRRPRTGTSLESMGIVLSTLPSPCYFQAFPKEKRKSSLYKSAPLEHFESPTKRMAKMVKSLNYQPRSPTKTNFSTNGIEPFPQPKEKKFNLYRPLSATCSAYDHLHP